MTTCSDDFKNWATEEVKGKITGALNSSLNQNEIVNKLNGGAAKSLAVKGVVKEGIGPLKTELGIPTGTLDDIANGIEDAKDKADELQGQLDDAYTAAADFMTAFPACVADPVLGNLQDMRDGIGGVIQEIKDVDLPELDADIAAKQAVKDNIEAEVGNAQDVRDALGL